MQQRVSVSEFRAKITDLASARVTVLEAGQDG